MSRVWTSEYTEYVENIYGEDTERCPVYTHACFGMPAHIKTCQHIQS